MPYTSVLASSLVALVAVAPAEAEKVVLRVPGGRLLRAEADGGLRAESFVPAPRETFELVELARPQVAVRAPDGRWLLTDLRDGRTPRVAPGPAQPGAAETYDLAAIGPGHGGLRSRVSGQLLSLRPAGTVEIYRLRQLPAILDTGLPAMIGGVATAELVDKQYDQTRKHHIEKYVRLPAPTLKDFGRTKSHQVLGLIEETRVQARLEGQPQIRTPAMRLLAGCAEGGSGLMLIAVEASLPLAGRVQYKVQDALSASTGYRTTVQVSTVVEVPLARTGSDLKVGSPAVLDLSVSLAHLDLSNDLLDVLRRQIEQLVNRELRHNEGRIREQANRAIAKALSSRDLRIPMLGALGLW